MRRLLVTLALLLAAGAASAATAPSRRAAPAPVVRSPVAAPAISFAPAPANPGLGAGLVSSLASNADPGPQCRAACSKARYTCSPEDTACDNRWTQCLAACR